MNPSLNDLRPSQITTCLAIGSLGLLILGIQPVLLAPLVVEERMLEADVGYLATAELVTIALGTILGVRLLRSLSARVVAILAGVVIVGVNFGLIARAGLAPLLALRSVAGVAEGVLVSLALVAIARSVRPERLAAFFLAGQTLLQLVVAAILPMLAFAGSRADAALAALAVAGGAVVLAAVGLPTRLAPAEPTGEGGAITLASGMALVSTGLYMGAIVVVWVFFGVWLEQNGHSPALEAAAVSSCLGVQIVGALIAARVSDRLPNVPTIAVCALVEILLIATLLQNSASANWITAAVAAFGFPWMFALPSFAGLLIAIDPERRVVLYFAAAQLIGSALVPMIGASLVGPGNVNGALHLGMASFAAAALTSAAASALHRRAVALVT